MRPSEKCREPVQTLDEDMPTMKRTVQRREREAVLSRNPVSSPTIVPILEGPVILAIIKIVSAGQDGG